MLLVCQVRSLNFHTHFDGFSENIIRKFKAPWKTKKFVKSVSKPWETMRKESSFYRERVINKKEFQSLLNPCVASSWERRELSFPNFNRKSSIFFHYLIFPKNKIYLVDILPKIKSIFKQYFQSQKITFLNLTVSRKSIKKSQNL